MRIISGKFRGKTLHPGNDFSARPTTDFAKESLFNILANRFDFEEVEVLDLFSGTGSISFEFASRECKHIDSVEMNAKHASFILKSIKEMQLDNMKLFRVNAFSFLKTCIRTYDIVFADPPYDMDGVETLPLLVLERNLLKPDGIFVLEHSKKTSFTQHPDIIEHRTYGSVNFSFFQKKI